MMLRLVRLSIVLLLLVVHSIGCAAPVEQTDRPALIASETAALAPTDSAPVVASTLEQPTPTVEEATPVFPTPTVSLVDIPPAFGDENDWTQLAHSPQRASYFPTEVSWPWQVKWIWNGPTSESGEEPATGHLALPKGVQPITGGGRLYVGHSDGVVRAISAENGQEAWASQSLGGAIVNAGAFDRDTHSVYFGAQNGKFHMLDAATGASNRVVDLRGSIDMAPLLAGETIYIGARSGILYALDKRTLEQRWSYEAGAALIASPAYSNSHGGLIILLAEDKSVQAVSAQTGGLRWRVTVNADPDTRRGDTVFADTFPVVSEANGVVVVRSYLDWEKVWQPDGGAPVEVADSRAFLTQNPEFQSFFVLDLDDGAARYVAPVLIGGIGNGGDLESVPPQVVVKPLEDGSEVAYLLWRNRQSCPPAYCDGRSDNTLGEMDLSTGDIRFVQDYKDEGNMRMPTDEQGALSMAGDMLFHAHWQLLGALMVVDRSAGLGDRYSNPILTRELTPVLNTLTAGECAGRANHYCPQRMTSPGESYSVDPGFYIYSSDSRIYDRFWSTPVRGAVISNGAIYWKSVDGAIVALAPANP